MGRHCRLARKGMVKPTLQLTIPDPKVAAKLASPETSHVMLQFMEYPSGHAQGIIACAGTLEECEAARDIEACKIYICFHGGEPIAQVDEAEEYRKLLQ